MRHRGRARFVSELMRIKPGVPAPTIDQCCAIAGQPMGVQVAFEGEAEGSFGTYDRPEAHPQGRWLAEEESTEDLPRVDIALVRPVPCELARYPESTGPYEESGPALVPDRIEPIGPYGVRLLPGQPQALWLETRAPSAGGRYRLIVDFVPVGAAGAPALATTELLVEVVETDALEPSFPHAEWLHPDALASHFGVEPYSEQHWGLIDEAFGLMRGCGVDTLYTPLLNPPLDTIAQRPRRNVQLLELTEDAGTWRVGLGRLQRWATLARAHGFTHLEFSHLFTQAGAAAPADTYDTSGRRIFGADVNRPLADFDRLLHQVLPQVRAWARDSGWSVLWHVSDEPTRAHLDAYDRAALTLRQIIPDAVVMDAIDDPTLARHIDIPVPIVGSLPAFAQAGIEPVWIYTSCASTRGVPNRHLAMPLARLRALGLLLWWHRIAGYLHWGFNFWNSQYSRFALDPNLSTDAALGFPSGDASVIYPAPIAVTGPIDGAARLQSSLRAHQLREIHLDVALLRTVEARRGRAAVVDLIQQCRQAEASTPLTWTNYPVDPDFYHRLRDRLVAQVGRSNP